MPVSLLRPICERKRSTWTCFDSASFIWGYTIASNRFVHWENFVSVKKVYTPDRLKRWIMYSKTPGLWKNQRMPTNTDAANCSEADVYVLRRCSCSPFIFRIALYCLWEFSYFIFLPKDELVNVSELLVLFSQSLSMFACIPKMILKLLLVKTESNQSASWSDTI